MRLGIRTLVLLSLLSGGLASAIAQEAPNRRGYKYGFWGSGAMADGGFSTATMHAGFGGDALVYKGIGIGAELGYLTPWQCMGSGSGLLSVDGSYHFHPNKTVSPFFTGGYSLAFRSEILNMVNFGGGVNWWLSDRRGIRLEARDHLAPEYADTHWLSFRIGFLFR
jgi:hypothetical protein